MKDDTSCTSADCMQTNGSLSIQIHSQLFKRMFYDGMCTLL